MAILGFPFSYKQTCRQKSWSHTLRRAGQGVKKLAQLGLTGEAQGTPSPATPARGQRGTGSPARRPAVTASGMAREGCIFGGRSVFALSAPGQGSCCKSTLYAKIKRKKMHLSELAALSKS